MLFTLNFCTKWLTKPRCVMLIKIQHDGKCVETRKRSPPGAANIPTKNNPCLKNSTPVTGVQFIPRNILEQAHLLEYDNYNFEFVVKNFRRNTF